MSPKMDSGFAEWSTSQQAADTASMKVAAADSAQVSFPMERAGSAKCFAPMTPPPEDRATVGAASSRSSAPRVRRRSALKIASTAPPLPSPPSAANKRRTPSSLSVNARSSSVVASEGMLFSRSELRPPPLSASRKYDGNVGFGCRSVAATAAASTKPGNWNGGRGDGSSSLSSPNLIATEGEVGGRRPPPMRDTGAVRSCESFATLRIIEARRRAAWSFSESSPSLSSPPPSLAALGSTASATTSSAAAAAKKATIPPLPKISSIFIPTAACPLRQPDGSNHKAGNIVGTTATRLGCFNTNPGPASSTARAETAAVVAVAAPLSEPRNLDKACKHESLEQKWAAWQENEGPAPLLGKPAPAPVAMAEGGRGDDGDPISFGGSSGGGESRKWAGVGDFHDKVAFLGDYVASVFGRTKTVSVPQQRRCDDGVLEVECGVE